MEKYLENIIRNAAAAESEIMTHIMRQTAEKTDIVTMVNDLLYKTAQEKGITLYELCSSVVPEVKQEITDDLRDNWEQKGYKMKLTTTVTLHPRQYSDED